MPSPDIHTWKKAPFIRLLLPLIAGIIVQWHLQLLINVWWSLFLVSFLMLIILFFIPFFNRFRFSWLNGAAIAILFFSIGALLVWQKDIRNKQNWLGHYYRNGDGVVVTLQEPPVEKTNSYKAAGRAYFLIQGDKKISVQGNIILYFQKDSTIQKLSYGSQIVFTRALQPIKNSGNPGGFDYERYSLFQGITHQAYIKTDEFVLIPEKNDSWFMKFIFSTREKVLHILRNYIKEEKELGLAEALLIGYKDDLDKNLVQSYSNTGVVHIIAISGLHLGLIYWLLVLLMKPLKKRKTLRWLRPVIIIVALWLFSLLAGGQPSVLRSAVMFTCIVLGDSMTKKTSIFNTLALSAFLLLCYNPYWLWDVGFQLSYTAVLSIVIFMRPVYNWFYIKNKLLDFIWKLNAVTIAAQILTLPISLYHFHQFPNFFLLTNFVAVPLSSIIVLGEILLCAVFFITVIATVTGKILFWLIWIMNTYVERIDSLPFAIWASIQISILQTILLLIAITGFSFWFLEKKKNGVWTGLTAILFIILLRSWSFWQSNHQQKIIVYNVPKHPAIDIISARNYYFLGDSELLKDDFIRNFHLRPTRIKNRVELTYSIKGLIKKGCCLQYRSKKIMLINKNIRFDPLEKKQPIDLIIISENPKIYISVLSETFLIKQVVFDGSVPLWKIKYWKKDCDSLYIPYYDINETGAFVMNL
ncbi:MAG: ComEC family competence protein [Bacteroidota bacterium]|nr:ComEC family competence protein [Bacteroidota bacterium]